MKAAWMQWQNQLDICNMELLQGHGNHPIDDDLLYTLNIGLNCQALLPAASC